MSLVVNLIKGATYAVIIWAFAFSGYRIYQEFKRFRIEQEERRRKK